MKNQSKRLSSGVRVATCALIALLLITVVCFLLAEVEQKELTALTVFLVVLSASVAVTLVALVIKVIEWIIFKPATGKRTPKPRKPRASRGLGAISILVRMQLKEQLNFKRFEVENVKVFHIVLSILGKLIKFAMVTALCIAFLLVSETFDLFSMGALRVPDKLISLVFTAMLLASVISCTVGLTKAMYYARDNAVLLTLPCTSLDVYLSKLIIFFLFEVIRNFSFLVPMFIAYFIQCGYPTLAYVWMLFCMLWVSLFTVSIGALLSIPAMWIANFFRQHRWLQISTLVAAVGAAVTALFWGISLIPENIDLPAAWDKLYWQIDDFLSAYAYSDVETRAPRWIYDLTRMMLGEELNLAIVFPIGATALRFLVLMGVTLVLLVAGILIVCPLFYKMASTPFEYLKRQVKPKKNRARGRVASSIYTNFLSTVKDSNAFATNVAILLSVPMMIFLLNKIFFAIKTREVGDFMVVAFNVLIMLLIVLNFNGSMASIFSRDGRSSYLIKTLPSNYSLPILAKLLPNTAFGVTAILSTSVILAITLSMTTLEIVMLIASMLMLYLAHMLYSAQLDLMNPQTELYATVGGTESNPNETKSTLWAFLISFVVAGVLLFLLIEKRGLVYEKLLIVSLAAFVYRVWMFSSTLKLYYKEK